MNALLNFIEALLDKAGLALELARAAHRSAQYRRALRRQKVAIDALGADLAGRLMPGRALSLPRHSSKGRAQP